MKIRTIKVSDSCVKWEIRTDNGHILAHGSAQRPGPVCHPRPWDGIGVANRMAGQCISSWRNALVKEVTS